jgi:phosphoribosyl 1,2-cyclic phosphate phosphodiesterase
VGRRVWETRNGDLRGWPPEAKRQRTTDVYLPEQVALDFRRYLGNWEHLEFMAGRGWVRVHVLADGETVDVGGVCVRPFRLAEDSDLLRLERQVGCNVTFAFDGLRAAV